MEMCFRGNDCLKGIDILKVWTVLVQLALCRHKCHRQGQLYIVVPVVKIEKNE